MYGVIQTSIKIKIISEMLFLNDVIKSYKKNIFEKIKTFWNNERRHLNSSKK